MTGFFHDGRVEFGERRFDAAGRKRIVAREFIAHQHRDFLEELAKVARARFLFAHEREFVLHERMVNDVKRGEARIFTHDGNTPVESKKERAVPARRKESGQKRSLKSSFFSAVSLSSLSAAEGS